MIEKKIDMNKKARVTWELPILDIISVLLSLVAILITIALAKRIHHKVEDLHQSLTTTPNYQDDVQNKVFCSQCGSKLSQQSPMSMPVP